MLISWTKTYSSIKYEYIAWCTQFKKHPIKLASKACIPIGWLLRPGPKITCLPSIWIVQKWNMFVHAVSIGVPSMEKYPLKLSSRTSIQTFWHMG
jgi:hypothetical protein